MCESDPFVKEFKDGFTCNLHNPIVNIYCDLLESEYIHWYLRDLEAQRAHVESRATARVLQALRASKSRR